MTKAIQTRSGPRLNVDMRRVATIVALTLFVGVLAYLVLVPIIRVQLLSFQDGAAGYRAAFSRPEFRSSLITTVQLTLGSLVIALGLGTTLAVAAINLPRRLRFLRMAPVLTLVIPFVASILGWVALLSPRPGYVNILLRKLPWWNNLTEGPVDIYSIEWIVIITGLTLTSYVYLFVSAGLANINSELIEAGRTSGMSAATVFFRITLPLLRPVLLYGGAVALLLGLGQFTAPLLLGGNAGVDVITTEMYFFTTASPANYGAAAAMASPLIVFGIFMVFFQRVILGDQSRFVTHGSKAFKPPGKGSKLAAVAVGLYSFVALIGPLLGLVYLSVSPFWRPVLTSDGLTLANFRKVFDTPNLTSAITTSLIVSVAAVAVVIPIGFCVALIQLKGRTHPIARWISDFVVQLPLGIPAAVFGVGFFYTYTREPFFLYGTKWVIVLVYVTLMLPFATRMLLSAMVALGNGYEEASRVSGAGAIFTYARITLPLIRPAVGGAGALMFVLLTHEFGASVLVRSPTTQVMGTALFDYWNFGSFPLTAAMAIVMGVITAIGVSIAMLVSGGRAFDQL